MSSAVERSARINLRVAPEADRLLRAAAAARNESLTSFLLEAGLAKARQTLEEERRLRLSTETFHRVLDELDRPAEVVEPLRDLFRTTGAAAPATAPRTGASHIDV